MKTRNLLILAAFLSSTLTACGGGGGTSGSVTPPGSGGSGALSSASTEDAIATADAVGSPVQDFANYNDSTGSPLQSTGIRIESVSPEWQPLTSLTLITVSQTPQAHAARPER